MKGVLSSRICRGKSGLLGALKKYVLITSKTEIRKMREGWMAMDGGGKWI